jgi:hypothetical protein
MMGKLKKSASGVLVASENSTYIPVRLVLLAACGLAGREFLNIPNFPG